MFSTEITTGYLSNSCFCMSLNALNSSALPEGSRKNIVACSPALSLNLMYGYITKSMLFDFNLSAITRQSFISNITPACGTGTEWLSTSL